MESQDAQRYVDEKDCPPTESGDQDAAERWAESGANRGHRPEQPHGAAGEITPSRYARGRHISVSRRGLDRGPIEEALKPFGLERAIVAIVGGFSTALALARASDLIASVPERQTGNLRAGMHSFPLPVPAPEVTISLFWHPRLDADPAHRWLRGLVLETCAAIRGDSGAPRARA
jgi:DNA-binding transcriptional LysR family regulator